MKNLPSLGIGFEFAPAQALPTAHPTGISDLATSSRSVLASWVCLRQGSGKPGGASQGAAIREISVVACACLL